jgi:hypothetical protein
MRQFHHWDCHPAKINGRRSTLEANLSAGIHAIRKTGCALPHTTSMNHRSRLSTDGAPAVSRVALRGI